MHVYEGLVRQGGKDCKDWICNDSVALCEAVRLAVAGLVNANLGYASCLSFKLI